MPLIGYFKGQPNEYVIRYSSGQIVREGQGLAFFYLKYKTQIIVVPTSSMDANLVFNEVTSSFQTVTIQGQFTYRDPQSQAGGGAAQLRHGPAYAYACLQRSRPPGTADHKHHPDGDPRRNPERSLEEVLTQYETIAGRVLERVKNSSLLDPLGVDLLSVYFVAAKPTPEVAKALEAEYRETLLRKADMAISARRAAAVEEERKIKENELNTEITLEQQRRQLIDFRANNALHEAANNGKALEEKAAYRTGSGSTELDLYASIDPRKVLALAMSELGHNAGQIGNLTITSEILAALLDGREGAPSPSASSVVDRLMAGFDKLVIITRRTALEELIERFNTRDQARFYIEHMGEDFASYQDAHDAYGRAVDLLQAAIPRRLEDPVDRPIVPADLHLRSHPT